jgi:hypothetical protein
VAGSIECERNMLQQEKERRKQHTRDKDPENQEESLAKNDRDLHKATTKLVGRLNDTTVDWVVFNHIGRVMILSVFPLISELVEPKYVCDAIPFHFNMVYQFIF